MVFNGGPSPARLSSVGDRNARARNDNIFYFTLKSEPGLVIITKIMFRSEPGPVLIRKVIFVTESGPVLIKIFYLGPSPARC